jgi:TRAP transporter TAXI family solute receptor
MKIQKKRFSEEIAQAIQLKITELGLREGDRLPSHASLARELNVSVPSLREGLQMLTTLGILQISHGRGTTVAKPRVSDYFRILNSLLQALPHIKEEYVQVRGLLEPHVAAMVADRGWDCSRLQESVESLEKAAQAGDTERIIEEELRFHRRLSRLAGNSVITEILSIVNRLLFDNPDVRENIIRQQPALIRQHRELIAAIENKDSDGAAAIMAEHLSLSGKIPQLSLIYDTFSSGSIGGTFYAVGRELCRILKTYGGIPIETESSGGGIENVVLTSEGKAMLGLTQSDLAHYAFQGEGPFFEPHQQIRAICGAQRLDLWIVARRDSRISSLADLQGRRIAMGALGGESGLIAKALLDAHGYAEGDYRPFFLSISNAVQGMLGGEIDVIFYLSSGPGSALIELAEDMEINILSLDREHLTPLLESHPYWRESNIARETWSCLSKDILTLGIGSILITHRDAPHTMIKTITRVIMEHAEEIDFGDNHEGTPAQDSALEGITIPLHPGAEEYYREKGILHG